MGFLKHLRSKSRLKDAPDAPAPRSPHAARYGRDFTSRLPADLLKRIFVEVCPHALDRSYEPSERSAFTEGCMLCDLRDLGKTAQVCRKWYGIAQDLLYGSVRIDAVHYCELEEILAEKRNRKSFLKSSTEAGDIPSVRLSLFCRTVRDSQLLATRVELLKLPYMTRETCKGDLARTVSALPNLRYVDLPEGMFTGDPSCYTLMHELQARCPDIRKMSYKSGSEPSLELLARRHWQSLEVLQLSAIAVEPSTLRIVLASLPTLHELTLSDVPWLDDTIFHSSPILPEFPPLQSLSLAGIELLTATGLKTYLSHPQNREALSSLSLTGTGVSVQDLHSFLWDAPNLVALTVVETVTKSLTLSLNDIPNLTSISLRELHFEITDSEEAHGLQKPSKSYYAYLAQSLHANALPAVSHLYVRDTEFPELLLLPPPPLLNDSPNPSAPASQPKRHFNQTLEVFSKGLDELEWVFTAITPPSAGGRRGSMTGGRPLSAYSASRGLGPQWSSGGFGGEARKSVIVGNGFGGFLAVPQDETPASITIGHNNNNNNGTPEKGASPGRWGSGGSVASMDSKNSRGSWLKPPPSLTGSFGSAGSGTSTAHGRNKSRHDLWR